jgi:hypothetical protein
MTKHVTGTREEWFAYVEFVVRKGPCAKGGPQGFANYIAEASRSVELVQLRERI